MKKLAFALPVLLLNACAYNSTMGDNDRFHVSSTASMFAPSVTTVLDTKTDSASTYAGPSIVGQVANAAGNVAGGYLLGQGIGKSGTKVSQNGGGATASSNAVSKPTINSSSTSSAVSNPTLNQSQRQSQGQFQDQSMESTTSTGHRED